MKTEETEDVGSNIINFQEAVKKLESKKKRSIALPNEKTLELLYFLYGAEDEVKLKLEILPEGGLELLVGLSRDVAHSLLKSKVSAELSLSRVDIDRIGDWFEIFKPKSRRKQRKVSSVIRALDQQFVEGGGLENPDFMKEVS